MQPSSIVEVHSAFQLLSAHVAILAYALDLEFLAHQFFTHSKSIAY